MPRTRRTTDLAQFGLAISALTEAWLGSMTYDDKRRYAATLIARECEGGGFETRAGDGCSLEATAIHRAALRACGVGDSSFVVRRAEAKIRLLGGYDHLRARFISHGEPEAIFCAMVSLVSAESLFPAPDAARVASTLRFGGAELGDPLWLSACAAVRDRFLVKRSKPSFLKSPEQQEARRRLIAQLDKLQQGDGSWDGAVHRTSFALITLEGFGVESNDLRVQRGLDWLERRKIRGRDGIAVTDAMCP